MFIPPRRIAGSARLIAALFVLIAAQGPVSPVASISTVPVSAPVGVLAPQATWEADFRFAQTLASEFGALAFAPLGTTSFVTETIAGRECQALRFEKGGGLQMTGLTSTVAANDYSLALYFRFDDTAGWRRVVDLRANTTDNGLYSHNGILKFFPDAVAGITATIPVSDYVNLVLTRNGADGVTRGYVGGAQQFVFTDTLSRATVLSGTLRLFKDADAPLANEDSGGFIARVRLWNGALSPSEVAALDGLDPTQCGVEAYATPDNAAQGGTTHVRAYGFAPATNGYYITLADSSGSYERTLANPVMPNAGGALSATVSVPADAPAGAQWLGIGQVNALAMRPAAVQAGVGCPPAIDYHLICIPYTVNPSTVLSVSPASARVGASVAFTATNLVAGQVRLLLGGVSVFSAGRVPAGTLSGSFIVPAATSLTPGQPATLTLQNLRAGVIAGVAQTVFTPLAASPRQTYTVQGFNADLRPNGLGVLTLTGVLSPAVPTDQLDRVRFSPMFRGGDRAPFPLMLVSKTLNPDGSFQLLAQAPSLFNGDAGMMMDNPGIGVNVVVDTPGKQTGAISTTVPLTANFKLTVQTYSGTLSAPIKAYVSLEGLGEIKVNAVGCTENPVASVVGANEFAANAANPGVYEPANQLDVYGQASLFGGNPADMVGSGASAKGLTNDGGSFNFDAPMQQLFMDANPGSIGMDAGLIGGSIGFRPSLAPGKADWAGESCIGGTYGTGAYDFRLEVSKPYTGVQPADDMTPAPGGQPGFVHHQWYWSGLSAKLRYATAANPATALSIDSNNDGIFEPMTSPLKVLLYLNEYYAIDNPHDALWGSLKIYDPQASPAVESVTLSSSPSSKKLLAKLGPELQEVTALGLGGGIPASPLQLYFDVPGGAQGAAMIQSASVRVLHPVTKVPLWTSAATISTSGSGKRISATMPDWRRTLISGTMPVEFVLYHPNYPTTIPHTVTNLSLRAEAVPAWFLTEYTLNRSATLNAAGQIELYGEKAPPDRTNRTPANSVEAIGQPANNSGVDNVRMTAYMDAIGTFRARPQNGSSASSIGANGGGAGLPARPMLGPEQATSLLDDLAGVAAGGPIKLRVSTCTKQGVVPCVGASAGSTTLGDYLTAQRISVFDTGWLPLYRNSWGIWPIANAQVGVDYRVQANLTAQADLWISTHGLDYSNIYLEPDASAGIDVWLNLSVLAGAVEAELHAVPQIGVDMALTVTNIHNSSRSMSIAAGFWYQLDAKYHACLAWCLKEKNGVQNIIPYGCITKDDGLGGSVIYPCRPALPVNKPQTEAPGVATSVPKVAPFLTADPSGRMLQVWQRESDGYLVSALDTGKGFGSPQVILSSTVGARPQAAFIGPSQAIAVWRHATDVSAGATLTQAMAAQTLRYAVLSNRGWSSDKLLTAPANGAGAPVIAGFYDSVTGRSEAVAAWTIDTVAGSDLAARQTRVYWSRYKNGTWSPSAPADPAGSAGESQPFVVYGADGVATLAWLRGTSDLATPANRRISFRRLDGVSAAQSPAALPGGVYEFSMTAQGSALNFAFTRIEASDAQTQTSYTPAGVLGDRKYLYAGTWNGSAWSQRKLRDNLGRSIKAESPVLTGAASGGGTISFRQLGAGASASGAFVPGKNDPIGVAYGSGELAQLNFGFTAASFDPANALDLSLNYLTLDGAVNWKTTAAFNPVLGKTVVSAVAGPLPAAGALKAQALAARSDQRAERMTVDEPIVTAEVEALPDLEVVSAALSDSFPRPGLPLTLTTVVRNNGAPTGQAALFGAGWDLPVGGGELAAALMVPPLGTGERITLTTMLTLPVNLAISRTLFVEVNPGGALIEAIASNNVLTLQTGGLPPPEALKITAQDNNPMIYLNWTQGRSDPRIIGW
ncbi:MAG: LamG domain-containing protein, partial [Thermoflexales bacterium]|nr:LamG domain-containing protein [Thermoflexales bacterium]